ncbi:MAG: bifunctional methylenetetrahydrofolate dehydrogenase/methenyltetrahydrofolate cyclohydrolase FolD [Acidobacteriota bacterium]
MGAKILDGTTVAEKIRAEVSEEARYLRETRGIVPKLSVILVGENPASQIYVRNKEKATQQAGMSSEVIRMPKDTSMETLLSTVTRLNKDRNVHGILVQLPLPNHLDEHSVIMSIDPDKDVDGFHPVNAGRLLIGLNGFLPCTPAGIIELLKWYEIPMKGKHAVVLGRSNIVGKPMAILLLREHATVTVCHSRTQNLPAVAATGDILVAAIGKKAMVTGDYIKEGAVVVDVGINRVTDENEVKELFGESEERLKQVRERGSTIVGDVHPLQAQAKAGYLTPVPGGVGPLTIAMLLKNTIESTKLKSGISG